MKRGQDAVEILLVEDIPADAELIIHVLRKYNPPLAWYGSRTELKRSILCFPPVTMLNGIVQTSQSWCFSICVCRVSVASRYCVGSRATNEPGVFPWWC